MNLQEKAPIFILAGGLGTRISEETMLKPKPMIEIGEIPILIHLMRSYYAYGFNDFVICSGYRSWEVKEYFLHYQFRLNHLMIDHRNSAQRPPSVVGENQDQESWRVRVIDTGLETMTGARIAKAFDIVSQDEKIENFGVTYGDGLSDINLTDEFEFHREHGRIGTLAGVPPVSRFGELDLNQSGQVRKFLEKPVGGTSLINGGFFFFNKEFRQYLTDDSSLVLEREPLEGLAGDGELMVYEHRGFWQCMDTLRDKNLLQTLWDSGAAPWLVPREKIMRRQRAIELAL